MKKVIAGIAVLSVCSMLFSGCATSFPQGVFFTQLRLPLAATSNGTRSPKVGTAECVSYLGLITTGDASIQTAKRNGGLTKIHHVDWEVENILGIIGKYKLIVYGE